VWRHPLTWDDLRQVKAGDVTRVRRIIMLGIDINARDEVTSKHASFNFHCSPRALCESSPSPVKAVSTDHTLARHAPARSPDSMVGRHSMTPAGMAISKSPSCWSKMARISGDGTGLIPVP
jgi:hypothetical protein